jgi:hypothetical protein
MSRCQPKAHSAYFGGKLFHLQPFEFVCGRAAVSKETGISEDMIKDRLEAWQKQGILKKSPNSRPNLISFYVWDVQILGAKQVFSDPNMYPNSRPNLNHSHIMIEDDILENKPQPKPQRCPNVAPTEAPLTRTRTKDLQKATATKKRVDVSSSSFFYDCLKEVAIDEIYKIDLSKEFPEIKVAEAVAYIQDERYVMKISLQHTLFWFCRSEKKIAHPDKPKPKWELLALKHNEIYAIHHPKLFVSNQERIKEQNMKIWQINRFELLSLGNPVEVLKKDFLQAEKEYKIAVKNHVAKNGNKFIEVEFTA